MLEYTLYKAYQALFTFLTVKLGLLYMNLNQKESDLSKSEIFEPGSLTLANSQNSQMSFRYGFFYVKFLFLNVVCVVYL